MPAISINAEKKAAIDAAIALSVVDGWFSEQLSDGFQTPGGWKLGLQQEDVALLTGNFVLCKEADALGLPLPDVIDMDGLPHSLTMAELTSLMLAYGQHRASLSAEYAARKSAISSGE